MVPTKSVRSYTTKKTKMNFIIWYQKQSATKQSTTSMINRLLMLLKILMGNILYFVAMDGNISLDVSLDLVPNIVIYFIFVLVKDNFLWERIKYTYFYGMVFYLFQTTWLLVWFFFLIPTKYLRTVCSYERFSKSAKILISSQHPFKLFKYSEISICSLKWNLSVYIFVSLQRLHSNYSKHYTFQSKICNDHYNICYSSINTVIHYW